MGVKRRARGGGPETRIVTGVVPEERTPGQVERAFRALLAAGGRLRAAGAARRDPACLLRGYTPKHEIRLFDAVYSLTQLREDANFRFFVAYVRLLGERPVTLYPRLFYKDSSLVWRCATHYIDSPQDNWIGKGDLKWVTEGDDEVLYSAEETTNLPLEIQCALDTVSRKAGRVRRDLRALGLVLRKAPDGRVAPYPDFSEPRRRARARRGSRVHGGEPVAWFEVPRDPESLRFAPGFEPDFAGGILEVGESKSRLYGGDVRKFRILSRERADPVPVRGGAARSLDHPSADADDGALELRRADARRRDRRGPVRAGLRVPLPRRGRGPPRLYSQIPPGFAGAASEVDPARADASPWLERLPVIREFRRRCWATLASPRSCSPVRRPRRAARRPPGRGLRSDLRDLPHAPRDPRAADRRRAVVARGAGARPGGAARAHRATGYRGMPPLGTCGFCSEDDLRRLIEFMAARRAVDGRTP